MHNLYRNTMAFVGQRPWHQLGVQFDQEFTSAEAIAAARLDYPVHKEQLYRLRPDLGPHMTEPIEAWATINGHSQDVLGVVGDVYEVLQNQEAFDFFDILLKEAGGKLQTAGAIGKGDQIIETVVTVPSNLTRRQEELLREFARLRDGAATHE